MGIQKNPIHLETNTLLKIPWFKGEIRMEIRNYFEQNDIENPTCHKLRAIAKVTLSEKFIEVKLYELKKKT